MYKNGTKFTHCSADFSMFLMLLVGAALVKFRIVEQKAGSSLSKIVLFVVLPYPMKRLLELTTIEQASWSYLNCGEIHIPLVVVVLSFDLREIFRESSLQFI